MQDALDTAGITLNKNTIPAEPCSPFNPSGIRMGTPIMSMRGMREAEMKQVAGWIYRVSEIIAHFEYREDKEDRKQQLKEFRSFISQDEALKEIREEVKNLCESFPIYK